MCLNIGVLINSRKREALDMGRMLYRWGKENEVSFLFPNHEAAALEVEGTPDADWLSTVEAAIVIGGDGTFLRASRYVLGHDIPLYGINFGRLGFLAFGEPESIISDVKMIVRGEYTILERPTLFGNVERNDEIVHSFYALNEFVLTKYIVARLLRIDVFLNRQNLGELSADGVIVASPTGSTAYALSAGGPIIPPHVACMVFVPICAHTLYARPIIAGVNDEIAIKPRDARDVSFIYDGQVAFEILPGDMITAKLSLDKTIKSIQMPHRTFLDLVHQKLGWGQSFLSEEKE